MAKLTKLITIFGMVALLSSAAYAGGYTDDDGKGKQGKKKLCRRHAALIPSPIRFPNEKYLCCPDDHFLYKLEDKEEENGRQYSKFANVDRLTCSRYSCDGNIVSVNKQETVAVYPYTAGSSSSSDDGNNGHDDDDSNDDGDQIDRRRLRGYNDDGNGNHDNDNDDDDDDDMDRHGLRDYDKYNLRCPLSPYNGGVRAITGFSHKLDKGHDDDKTEVKGIVCADVDGAEIDLHHCSPVKLGMKAEDVPASRSKFQRLWWPLGLRVCPGESALVALYQGKHRNLKWGLCCNVVQAM